MCGTHCGGEARVWGTRDTQSFCCYLLLLGTDNELKNIRSVVFNPVGPKKVYCGCIGSRQSEFGLLMGQKGSIFGFEGMKYVFFGCYLNCI